MTAACRLGDQQAERAAGTQHLADPVQRGDRVDDLEHAVAEHDVGAVDAHHLDQVGQVALLTGDLDPDLPGPAGERSQGVGTGVDHGDPVSGVGHPDCEATGAAADVDDVARPASSSGPRASHTTAVRAEPRRSPETMAHRLGARTASTGDASGEAGQPTAT